MQPETFQPEPVPAGSPRPEQPAPAPLTAADTGIIFENMGSNLTDYLGTSNPLEMYKIITGPFIALAIAIFIVATHAYTVPGVLNWGGLIILVCIGSAVSRIRNLHDAAILERFARSNNFDFDPNGTVDETYGTIFRVSPEMSKATDVVTGTFHGHAVRLFNFTYTVGSGKNSHSVDSTVCELDLDGKLPHLMLINQKAPIFKFLIGAEDEGLGFSFGPKETVSLEGDFNKNFTLLAEPGQTEAALVVFTPDVMALMQDTAKKFTTELIANKCYIYSVDHVNKESDLADLFSVAEKLSPKLGPLASRLASDGSIPVPAKIDIPAGLGMIPKSFSTKVVIIMIVIGMMFPLGTLVFLLIAGNM